MEDYQQPESVKVLESMDPAVDVWQRERASGLVHSGGHLSSSLRFATGRSFGHLVMTTLSSGPVRVMNGAPIRPRPDGEEVVGRPRF